MAAPVLQAQGAQPANATTGSVTPVLPAHQANDILLACAVVWLPNTVAAALEIPIPSGWTQLGSQMPHPAATNDGWIAWFWKRATSGSEANPVFTRATGWDSGTDTAYGARTWVIRGCITTGDPWDAASSAGPYTTANGQVPAVTVSDAERMVLQIMGSMDNQAAGTISGWTAGTATTDAGGTDTGFQTFRKDNVSASTSAQASAVAAPAQGAYGFMGISFKPPLGSALEESIGDTLALSDAIASRDLGPRVADTVAVSDSAGPQTFDDSIITVDGPAIYFPLRDAAGATTADDVSANNRDGTVVSSVVFREPGPGPNIADVAARFGDTSSTGIEIADFGGDWTTLTVETWIYVTSDVVTDRVMVEKVGEYGFRLVNGADFAGGTAGQLNLALVFSGVNFGVVGDPTMDFKLAENRNRWIHVAATFSDAADEVKFYRDRVLTTTLTGVTLNMGNGTGALNIGRYPSGVAAFVGRLARVAVFNNVLTAARIAAHGEVGGGAALTRSATDSVAVSDAQSVESSGGRSIADSVTVADTTALQHERRAVLADMVMLADDAAALAGAVSELILEDTLALADAITSLGVGRGVADTLALTDAVATEGTGALNRSVADSLTLADSASTTHGAQRALGDSATLVDATALANQRSVADSVALVDAVARNLAASLADTAALADVINTEGAGALAQNLADTLPLADATALNVAPALADTAGVTDAQALRLERALADEIVLSDELGMTVSLAVFDSVTLADLVIAGEPTITTFKRTRVAIIPLMTRAAPTVRATRAAIVVRATRATPASRATRVNPTED